jgi:hypothetical protein
MTGGHIASTRSLRQCTSGVAVAEFAMVLPFLLTASLFGLELANQAITQMEISQLAMQIADNASRVGDTSTLENRKIYESDIDDLLTGADIQAGSRIGLFDHGRVIISSLEVVPGTVDRQYIHWQRCLGTKNATSSFGAEGDGTDGRLAGMGPPGQEVTAFQDQAVIFVEIAYDYQPLIGEAFAYTHHLWSTASFVVRDDRDLSQIYQRDAGHPDPVAACNTYGGAFHTA